MGDYFSFHYSSYPVKATMGQLLIAAQYPSLVLENMKCLSLCVQGGAPVPGRVTRASSASQLTDNYGSMALGPAGPCFCRHPVASLGSSPCDRETRMRTGSATSTVAP